MSGDWTEALAPPIRASLRGARWSRIERARTGGWHLLRSRSANGGEGPAVEWYFLDEGSALGATPTPLLPDADPRLPQIPEVTAKWRHDGIRAELLSYRPGSRAVYRLESAAGTRIAKLYHGALEVISKWRHFEARPHDKWRTPRDITWDEERHMLQMEAAGAPSLYSRWRSGDASAADGASIADLVAWIQNGRDDARLDSLPRHTHADEVRMLEERFLNLQRVLAVPLAMADAALRDTVRALHADPLRPLVAAHRDLHDKQILVDVDGSSGVLIDLDLAAAAPAALDLGNMIAHARLRALQGFLVSWQEIAAEAAAPALREGLADTLFRWTASALLRLSFVYAFRERSPELIPVLLGSAREALERRGEWKQIL